jgi:hypothetical protein
MAQRPFEQIPDIAEFRNTTHLVIKVDSKPELLKVSEHKDDKIETVKIEAPEQEIIVFSDNSNLD